MKKAKFKIIFDNLTLAERTGYQFYLPFGFVGFVTKEGKLWRATEAITGRSIGQDDYTRYDAIQNAIDQFNRIGKDKIVEAVEKYRQRYTVNTV